MENATAWQERAPGRQHQQQQGRACPYCTVLGPGHGERAAPALGTSPSTQKWKEERQGALEQTDSNVPAHLWALSPEAVVQAAVSSLESSCCHQAPLTAHREWGCSRGLSLPAARPAALGGGGDRLRPFRGQIQGTSRFLQSMKMNQLAPALAF